MSPFTIVLKKTGQIGSQEEDASATLKKDESERLAEEIALREKLRKQAQTEGFEEGKRAGILAGLAKGESAVASLIEQLSGLIADIGETAEDGYAVFVDSVVKNAIRLAETITASPVAVDRRALHKRLLHEVRSRRMPAQVLICRAHPETMKLLGDFIYRLGAERKEDLTMAEGGIVITVTDAADRTRMIAEWDASVSRQIEALRSLPLPNRKQDDHEG